MPVIDTLTAPIPILSDLAGEPFTLLDLAEIFGSVDPAFIETVADILDVIGKISDFVQCARTCRSATCVLYTIRRPCNPIRISFRRPRIIGLADIEVLLRP